MNLGLDKWNLCFVIYMFLSNNPSSGGYKFVEFALLPVHPASFAHSFVSGMQSFYFSKSQDAIVLQTSH